MEAWRMFEEHEYEPVWQRFYRDFDFRPGVYRSDWPGIKEPVPSRTYNIGHIYGPPDRFQTLLDDLSDKMLTVFRHCTPVGDRICALDWQHTCYWFYPHVPFEPSERGPDGSYRGRLEWAIPILPNGDYYIFIFLNPDFHFGVFGHPWEQTMCLFGEELLTTLDQHMPELFSNLVRRNGKPLPPAAPR